MTATPEVVYGEQVRVGHPKLYAPKSPPLGQLVTIDGEPFISLGERLFTTCGHCEPTAPGVKPWYGHVLGGECFQCRGAGVGREVAGGIEGAVKIVKRRKADRARRQRKAEQAEAAAQAAGTAWREAHPELAETLTGLHAQLVATMQVRTEAEQDAREALYAAWGDFVLDLANTVGMGRALSEKQTAAVVTAMEQAREAQAAEQARRAAERFYGAEGDKVTAATGTVAVATTVETRYGASRLIVVEGSGDYAGVTFKMFGSGETLWGARRDDTVTVTGTVKAHETYQGTPQTVLARGKLAPA